MNEHIKELSNGDVMWEGTYFGLAPFIDRDKTERLSGLGDQVIPELITALLDEEVFVAAHVILTRLSGVEYQAFPTWNGLKVELMADGTAKIAPEQRFDLAQRWERWYHTQPRPKVLPADN